MPINGATGFLKELFRVIGANCDLVPLPSGFNCGNAQEEDYLEDLRPSSISATNLLYDLEQMINLTFFLVCKW